MNQKGNRYALAALKNKRATLASEIIQFERQLKHRRDCLVHVDATLRMLDPSIDVGAIPNKRAPKRVMLFRQGELGRAVLDALRLGGEPMSIPQIAEAIAQAKGYGEDARSAMMLKVRATLGYQRRHGKVAKTGKHRAARWRLAHS